MTNRFENKKEKTNADTILNAGKKEVEKVEEIVETKELTDTNFLDEIVLEKVQKAESKAKSYYLEKEVASNIKKLAKRSNKTESQFVNDILKQITKRYL